jgi:hypothetical protein
MSNYIQPGSPSTSGVSGNEAANRAINPTVTVMPHQAGDPKANPLNLVWPIPRYVDPGISAKDDPGGVIRGHL